MHTTILRTGIAAIALALGASACGSSSGTDQSDAANVIDAEGSTSTMVVRPEHDRDELVSVDNRRVHLRCVGRGSTTVLLIAGWDDGGDKWGAIEPGIADRARVCSYARLGTGASDPQPATQTFATQAAGLHALLTEAGEPGPYVVTGQSFGGAEAVTFASMYADEVVGLLLLDASPSDWPATVCTVPAWADGCALMHDPALDPERLDVFRAFEEVAAITSLGGLPMTVVTAAHRTDPGPSAADLARLDRVWVEGTERWAALSPASSIVVVDDTGHHIEVDQPQLVVEELLRLLPS